MNLETAGVMSALPPVIERYELKYVIPYSLVEPVSRFLEPCCGLDAHSMGHPDQFYPVNSLYFDTPDYRFLKQRMWGSDRRFNMRVRAYGDGRAGPYFAEIKYKTPTSVKKFRASLETSDWPGFLCEKSQHGDVSVEDGKDRMSRQLFLRLAESYAAEPKIFTCYRRRAFLSLIDDYARVTFDIDLRYRPQESGYASDPYSLSPGRDCVNYDAETIYGDEYGGEANVVLELKASVGAVPVWMIELIRRFELKQVGFSKYLNSSRVGQDNGWHYMENDRSAGQFLT